MSEKLNSSTRGVGKRAHRSARIKVDVYLGLLKIAGQRQLDEIAVEELCAESGISKVTFFKYFPQKEDLLMYFLRVWCFHRALELNKQPKHGMQGIYYLFERMAETYERYPGLVISTMAAIANQKRPSVPMPLKLPEKQLLGRGHTNLKSIDVLSIPQLIEKHLLESTMKGDLRYVGTTKELATLFLTLFYGTILARHNRSMDSLRSEFRRNIEFAMNGLKG